MHTAESYIQDWAEEGLSEQDFFYVVSKCGARLQRDVQQNQKRGEPGRGKVVGHYHFEAGLNPVLLADKIDTDLRRAIEFVLRVKPYSEAEILKKDIVTFLRILAEAEQEEIEKAERLKKQADE
jgi:hypothetical protein